VVAKKRVRELAVGQPDFQALFFDHFGQTPARQRYELRFGTHHLHHDVVFLSSLLQDARLSRAAVRGRRGMVVIAAERDTWELGSLVLPGAPPLHHCPCRITVGGVAGVEWDFDREVPDIDAELWLSRVRLERRQRGADGMSLLLEGAAWCLRLAVHPAKASVVMQDAREPRAHARAAPARDEATR
jgi:hypothetical protein